jgi:hypothetical protein
MLASAAGWNFDVITAGPNGTMSVPQALARPGVRLYAQPGADGDDDAAYRRQKRDKSAIKQFVHEGGRYLGSAWAASWPNRATSMCSEAGSTSTTPPAGHR